MAQQRSGDPLHQKYLLSSRIGYGAYGIVHSATCAETGVAKAIKAVDPSARKSGRDSVEIQVLQQCQHPNVIELEEIIDAVPSRPAVALVFRAYGLG